MDIRHNIYIQILAYGLSDDTSITPPCVEDVNWKGFFTFCRNQAILGIGLACLDKLKKHYGDSLVIPQNLLFKWIGIVEQIKAKNLLLNERTRELTEYIANKGKRSCILKGQGNASMYPDPLLRTSGDIDVWVEGTKKDVVDFVHKDYPQINVEYHHMQYPVFEDVEVEVHYYPSFCYNKWHNKRLLQYFKDESEKQFNNSTGQGYNAPTVPFNLVFQLSHMMRHFFTQGIGLRHAIDYYYLLNQEISDSDKLEIVSVMKRCGMYKFFCAMLWIECELFGLSKNTDIAPGNKNAGMIVLNEMLKGGNFGHSYRHNSENIVVAYVSQILYNMQYIIEFPSEPISRPFTLIWDYVKKRLF